MSKVIFIGLDGTKHIIDAKHGQTAMEAAVRNDVPGIPADCGGACSCATCHVYVDEEWIDRLGMAEGDEDSLLDLAEGRQENSRLSCQIKLSEALDGLVLHVPDEQ
ncbi:2Fe-2S iron-sulfur cluster-binding protein [Rhizorhabdus argentea]|uniref:2Fe-2S iron-sulfur cluster-binding protein n=1 Tax=Rhizorhabdus argentea TaxID=1387174 RepID=UPI0030EE3153